ncbi:hypothetical protein KQI65_16515 [bacterium]|nr:hypothetical protein [bacterium]
MKRIDTPRWRGRLERIPVWSIIAAAIGLRLVFGLVWMLAVNVPPEDVPVAGDTWEQAGADGYLQIARTLLISGEYAFEPGGLPVHNRPPVQPIMLLIFGAWWPSHWYIPWMFGSALLCLVALFAVRALARDMHFSHISMRLMLLLVAFHPYFVFASKTSTFVNTAAALLPLILLTALRIPRRPLLYAPLAGLLMGIGALTHGTFLLIPFLLAALLLWKKDLPPLRRIAASGAMLIVALLVVAPWTYRNLVTFDRFIPVVTGNGYHYWKGEAIYFGGDYPMAGKYEQATGREFKERYYGALYPEMDAVLWDLAKKDMVERPQLLPLRIIIGTATFFAPWDRGAAKAVISILLTIPFLLAMIVLFFRRWRAHTLTFSQVAIALVLTYIVEAYSFFCAWGSYFNMLVPLAAVLLISLSERRFSPLRGESSFSASAERNFPH